MFINNSIDPDFTIYKKVKCGNWHDGYAINTIVKLLKITTEEKYVREYCIEYYNYMCQIYTVYAKHVE